jgi:hypothetical protein
VKKGGAATRLGVAAVVALAAFGAASMRLVMEARSALAASDAALTKGDAIAAAVHARDAARSYVPFATHMEQGLVKLRDIANKSERKGDAESALFAWRALLAAATSARPFSSDVTEMRAEAQTSIARLSAAMESSASARSGAARGTSTSPPGTDDSVAEVPPLAWGALLVIGALMWWGAGLRLTSRGWGSDGRLVPREVRIAAVMALAGLLAWVSALLLG